eukprot:4793410-Pyramimonas_sp.AAC.1
MKRVSQVVQPPRGVERNRVCNSEHLGAMGIIERFEESIAVNAAGGPSRALGSSRVACPNFRDGHFA